MSAVRLDIKVNKSARGPTNVQRTTHSRHPVDDSNWRRITTSSTSPRASLPDIEDSAMSPKTVSRSMGSKHREIASVMNQHHRSEVDDRLLSPMKPLGLH